MENPSRCINCSLRLRYLRWQSLREVNDETYSTLAFWISPTPISREDVICMECFSSLQNALQARLAPAALFGHKCVLCMWHINTTCTYIKSASRPRERNIILRFISPHLAPHLNRVCRAYWMAARRIVQRQFQQDANRGVVTAETEAVRAPVPPPLFRLYI